MGLLLFGGAEDRSALPAQGELRGKTVLLAAAESISNTGGTIRGDAVTLKAGQDIISSAATATFQSRDTTATHVSQRGAITSGGALNMEAGRDIALLGTDVSSGGDAKLKAGRDVSVSTASTGSRSETSGRGYNTHAYVTANQGSTLASGGALSVEAGQDLAVHGSRVGSAGDMDLSAGRHVSITSAADSVDAYAHAKGKSGGMFGGKHEDTYSLQQTTNVASTIRSGGKLNVEAGKTGIGDLVVSGSKAGSAGDMSLKAANDVLIASAQESSSSSSSSSKSGLFSSKSQARGASSTTQVGSELDSGGTMQIDGRTGVTVSASAVHGTGDVTLKSAEGDVRAVAAQNDSSSYSREKKSGIGLFFDNNRLDIARFKEERSSSSGSGNVGSTITSAHDVTTQAARDVGVVGSTVAASNDVTITAGRDVNILPGRNAQASSSSSKKGGIGIGFSLSETSAGISAGYKSTETGENRSGQYNAKSVIHAGNDVSIEAGRSVNQVSSEVAAGRDVKTHAGQDINVAAAQDVEHLDSYVKEVEAGISLAVRQSVTTAGRTLVELPQAATAGQGGAAAQAVTAGSAGLQAVSSVQQAMNSAISASAGLGVSVSESRQSSDSATSVPSSTAAGRDVIQTAGQDLRIQGGNVAAERDVRLTAGRDVSVTAANNQYSSSQSGSSESASIGLGASVGLNGVSGGVQTSASASGSEGQSQAATHTNARIGAGETLALTSGQDTTVAGANLAAKDVKMDVGRDLIVASLQDTSSSSSSNWDSGGSVTVGTLPDIGGLLGEVAKSGPSASVGGGSGSSSSAWVNGQTTILGSNSVDIRTEKNTDLRGAVIASANDNLKLDTGSLTFGDIQDKDSGSSTQAGVSGSLGKPLETATVQADYQSHDKRQANRATIGKGEIIIRSDPAKGLEGLNRDLQKAQEITKDSKTSVKVFIDTAAIKTITEVSAKIIEEARHAKADAEMEKRLQQAQLPDDLKNLEKAHGLDIMKGMIASGASDEEINRLFHEPEFQNVLLKAASLQAQLEKDGLSLDIGPGSSSATPPTGADGTWTININYAATGGTALLGLLHDTKAFYDSIPHKEEAALALVGLQLALNGPLAVAWEVGKSAILEGIAGKEIEQAKQQLSIKFAELLTGQDHAKYNPTDSLDIAYWDEYALPPARFGVDLFIGAAGILASKGGGKTGSEKLVETVLPKSVIELSEANIRNSGITVLGSYPGYIDKATKNNASYFNIGNAWSSLSVAQQEAANYHFLDIIAKKGDTIYLSTHINNIIPKSSLAKEIKYLTDNYGYKIVNGLKLQK